ncbi:MAG: tetratricopeptide repeat protein [Bacteroidota bacterium]
MKHLCIFLGILLMALFSPLHGQSWLETFNRQVEMEQSQAAETWLLAQLPSIPKEVDRAYYYLGRLKLQQGNTEAARQYFEKGLAVRKKSALHLAGMGAVFMKQGEFLTAYEWLGQAQNRAKKQEEVFLAIAEAYLEGGRSEQQEGKTILYRLRQNPQDEFRITQGLVRFYTLNFVPELAIEELEKLRKIKPEALQPCVALAQLYLERGKSLPEREAAATDFLKGYQLVNYALELNASYGPAYRLRAELYLISRFPDKFERGKKDMETYLSLQEGNREARIRYAQFLFLAGEFAEALTAIEALAAEAKLRPVMQRLKAMSLAELARYEEARGEMETYFTQVKEAFRIGADYESWGDILRNLGALEAADQAYEKAINLNPNRNQLFAELADSYLEEARNRKKTAPKTAETQASLEALFDLEAHYRELHLDVAEPVRLADYKDWAVALQQSGQLVRADSVYQRCTAINAEYVFPLRQRLRIAYQREEADPDSHEWYAKTVAEDVIAIFDDKPERMKEKDLPVLLLSYQIMALYHYNPSLEKNVANCEAAKPWLQKIIAIKPDYEPTRELADYCLD